MRRRMSWRRGSIGWLAEGKHLFVEDNVSRSDHPTRRGVVATVAAVIRGVADEDAWRGAGGELVTRGGREVGKAVAPEHT